MNQWKFNPQEGDNAVSDNDEIVFYIDDLNPEVVAKIVEIQNANADGDFASQIDEYLGNEERCSPDEREFVMEQINNYVKLNATPAADIANATPQQPAQQGSSAEEGQKPSGTPAGAGAPPPPPPPPPPPAQEKGRRGAGGVTGGTRRTQSGGTKAESTEELIKSLQDKIDLIKLLDKAEVIEVPAGLGKTARDIMTEFQKEQEATKLAYMERVKNM